MKFDVSVRVIAGSIDIEASPEKIWGLLTSTDEITNWYDEANNVTHLHPEGTFQVGSRFLLTRGGIHAPRRAAAGPPGPRCRHGGPSPRSPAPFLDRCLTLSTGHPI